MPAAQGMRRASSRRPAIRCSLSPGAAAAGGRNDGMLHRPLRVSAEGHHHRPEVAPRHPRGPASPQRRSARPRRRRSSWTHGRSLAREATSRQTPWPARGAGPTGGNPREPDPGPVGFVARPPRARAASASASRQSSGSILVRLFRSRGPGQRATIAAVGLSPCCIAPVGQGFPRARMARSACGAPAGVMQAPQSLEEASGQSALADGCADAAASAAPPAAGEQGESMGWMAILLNYFVFSGWPEGLVRRVSSCCREWGAVLRHRSGRGPRPSCNGPRASPLPPARAGSR